MVASQFFERLKYILNNESVDFDEKVLPQLILKFFPDWRRTLNECQRYAATGNIDSAILVDVADVNLDTLLKALKSKHFSVVKNWVVQHMDNDPTMVMRKIYDSLYDVLKPSSIPEAVLIIAKYMNSIPIVPDQEINLLACLTEVMMSCEFK